MILENKYKLPERVVRRLGERRPPVKDRMSTTHLIDAPRIRTLLLTKWDEIRRDYNDLLPTLVGNAMHAQGEASAVQEDDEIAEQKMEIVMPGPITLVGKADNFKKSDGVLIDEKNLALSSMKFVDTVQKYVAQLNIYAWMRTKLYGDEVKVLILDIYYKDWKWMEFLRSKEKLDKIYFDMKDGIFPIKGYPPSLYQQVRLPLWSYEQQEQYILDQLEYHAMNPMDCSDTDRWKNDDIYAIMKKGRKSAVRSTGINTPLQAEKIIRDLDLTEDYKKGIIYLDHRKGECTRCVHPYCACRSVCPDSNIYEK